MSHPTLAERKKRLIAEGQKYRFGLSEAREEISASLQMDTLARKALGGLASGAATLLAARAGKSAGVPGMLPLLVSGVGALLRRAPVKPAVRTIAIAGVLGAVGAFLLKRRAAKRDDDDDGYDG